MSQKQTNKSWIQTIQATRTTTNNKPLKQNKPQARNEQPNNLKSNPNHKPTIQNSNKPKQTTNRQIPTEVQNQAFNPKPIQAPTKPTTIPLSKPINHINTQNQNNQTQIQKSLYRTNTNTIQKHSANSNYQNITQTHYAAQPM